MCKLYQLQLILSAQNTPLQRQQDTGRSSYRAFLAERLNPLTSTLYLKLTEANQQHYHNNQGGEADSVLHREVEQLPYNQQDCKAHPRRHSGRRGPGAQ